MPDDTNRVYRRSINERFEHTALPVQQVYRRVKLREMTRIQYYDFVGIHHCL